MERDLRLKLIGLKWRGAGVGREVQGSHRGCSLPVLKCDAHRGGDSERLCRGSKRGSGKLLGEALEPPGGRGETLPFKGGERFIIV